ncbi:hypothetical protein CANARDRAFT_8856 [[Candida] arabinofermentans NRRL YB-2248]|uniref:Polynucleotide 5'-hydroxyl-kinase GRC3 n=1 Tax=[Candida] arabinofermentans NRRL YB-2248 TaxID=983967 RepID=A0A1E4SXF2_9ASCO|nr:hypothetical protein CANARDRAFT_8856 [[Candida] arabinofermentans NRRL YB-2248]
MSSGRLSAFAALNNSDSDHSDDDGIVGYTNDDDDLQVLEPLKLDLGLNQQQPQQPTPQQQQPIRHNPTIISNSKFKPTDDNIIYNDNYTIIGLKSMEYLMIRGQYELCIQRGAIKIDSITYHSNPNKFYKINASSLNSIPLIIATQVTSIDHTNDTKTKENEHLFHSDYKSVIKISNLFNGLESIGKLYPQLKNIYPNWSSNDDLLQQQQQQPMNEYEKLFFGYSFQLIINKSNYIATTILKTWQKQIDDLINQYLINLDTGKPFKVLIIGSKNSGKSTFLKLLLNELTTLVETLEIKVLDVDPGQTEYSNPDCISLSNHDSPIFGLYMPCESNSTKNEYIGFNTPQREPLNYIKKLKNLINELNEDSIVLINTPGWIKGFGIELLKEITNLITPTHLIYLTNNLTSNDETIENELLNNLKYDKLIKVQSFQLGNNNSTDIVKYSPAQIRNFKLLSYLHYDSNTKKYNFEPLISKSPLKISYFDSKMNTNDIINFNGICSISILDNGFNLNHLDIIECLECQIVAIISIELDEYLNLNEQLINSNLISMNENLPNLIKDSNILNDYPYDLLGLGLIHSVNTVENYINLYTPINMNSLKDKLETNSNKLVLIKGRSDLPIEEIMPRNILDLKNKNKENKKRKGKRTGDFDDCEVPYVSFSSNLGKGGKTSNIRRNIMRRAQQ